MIRSVVLAWFYLCLYHVAYCVASRRNNDTEVFGWRPGTELYFHCQRCTAPMNQYGTGIRKTLAGSEPLSAEAVSQLRLKTLNLNCVNHGRRDILVTISLVQAREGLNNDTG